MLAFFVVGCSALGFSGTCVAGLPKTEWLPHDPIGMGFLFLHLILYKNSKEVGCLALGFSGIGRAGFPKTK